MPLCRIVLLNILLIAVCASCSDDDVRDIALEDVRLSFYDSAGWIHAKPPAAMLARPDYPIAETMKYLDYANRELRLGKGVYFRPDEATLQVVDTAVAGGKPGVRYRTGLYTDTFGLVHAHQVSVQNNTYIFEYFIRHPIDATHGRWRHMRKSLLAVRRKSGCF